MSIMEVISREFFSRNGFESFQNILFRFSREDLSNNATPKSQIIGLVFLSAALNNNF
jgi:hypothetical protein